MKDILSCLVEVPKADARWWPDLYLRKGRRLLQVTPEQLCAMQGAIREKVFNDGGKPSQVRNIPVHDIDGQRIGYVSFNGRVWLHDCDGDKEVPREGVETCAELDAKGWQ